MSKFGAKAKTAAAPAATTGGSAKEPKNVTLFDLRLITVQGKEKLKIQLQKDVQVTYKGVPVDLGEYNSMILKDQEDMENDLSFLVEKEYMTEDQANDRANFIQEKKITHEAKTKNPKLASS